MLIELIKENSFKLSIKHIYDDEEVDDEIIIIFLLFSKIVD